MNLRETDVRNMIRLLGKTAAVQGGHEEMKRCLLDGLSQLVGADAWSWVLGVCDPESAHQSVAGILHGGFSEERFTNYLKAVAYPESTKAALPLYETAYASREHTTMDHLELDPAKFAEQGTLGELWGATGLDATILSGKFVDDESLSLIGLYRLRGKPHYSGREKQISHIVLTEVPWLHLSGWPEEKIKTVPQLYPQQKVILNLLLDGRSRKEIAAQLDIKENTVSGYVKNIYRHFSVNSHPELMRKFSAGTATASSPP